MSVRIGFAEKGGFNLGRMILEVARHSPEQVRRQCPHVRVAVTKAAEESSESSRIDSVDHLDERQHGCAGLGPASQ